MSSSADQDAADRLADRVTELEALFMHLQRSVHDLDKVILDQQKQLDGLRGQLSRLMLQLDLLADAGVESRRIEDEKPPHY
jgi:uncharacterized coiled-coil protein SlyX